jgi:uncharacterized protein YjbI with pentapeptide repeats/basic membrane lipoprotein Med (substrate-binding protein (PBP1-ABC) superfamily)
MKMHLRDLIIRMIIGILMVAILVTNSYATEEKSPKQILILASYNPGLRWTDSIGSEIENQLSIYYPTAQFFFEYMDTKKQAPNEARLDELKKLYQSKYKDSHFDVIICSDDDAFQFLLNNRDELFPGTPVVFCGVNFFEDDMLSGKKGFTGVVEAFDLPNTISLMLKLHPETNQIVIVNDRTTTGKANREVMNQTLPNFSNNISFAVWDNMTVEELQKNASALQDGSLILLLNYNRDREGKTLTHEESAWTLRSASSVPIYGTRDVYMGFGVLGGMITAGPVQGSLAADLALRILLGEPADKIPVIKTPPNYYMFDMLELRRFNISLSRLPSDSIFVNQPLHPRVDLSDKNLSGLDLSGSDLVLSELQRSDLRGTNLSRSCLNQSSLFDSELVRTNLSGVIMVLADLHGSDLSLADLSNAFMPACNLLRSNLTKANLRGSYMPTAYLIGSNLNDADLSGSYMDQSFVDNSTLVRAKMNGASLWAVKMSDSNLSGASFVKALMVRSTFQNSQLNGDNLTRASLIGANLINATVTYADLSGADLSEARCGGANFSGSKLVKSTLGFTNLTSTNLSMADLSGSYLVASNLDDSNLTKAVLSGANLENAFMRWVKLVEAKLSGASLNGARLDDSDLSRSDLRETDLSGASLTGSNLTGADLSDARLVGTDLTLAVISGATLSRTSLVGSKLNWAKLSGSSFTDCQFARAEFFGADLSNSDLSNSDFTRAYLNRANLSGSRMENTVLDHTDLTNANLSNADLSNSDLENVYLNNANLSYANLAGLHMEAFDQRGTIWRKANLRSITMKTGTIVNEDFSGADLRNAHFAQVYINGTKFIGANLSGAVFDTTAFENVDFSGADLREIKYDMVALQFFAASKLDGAQMSPDLQKDLERLRSGQTNSTKVGAAADNFTDSNKAEPKLGIKSVGTGIVVSGGSASNKTKLNVVLLDFGPIGDHGWTYEAHVGAAKMTEKLPYVNLTERENAAGPNASQIMREYAERGADLIFCHSLAFEDAIKEVAPEYPNTTFMLGGGTKKLAPNAGTYYGRIYEAQYLAGIVAGNMTKTDKIAFPAALPDPEVIIGIDAFAKGVASTNPDARVYVEWIGNWYDPEKEKSVAASLINEGCDVITYWSDSDATGEVAEETGTYFISFGSDLRRFTSHVFLTGVKWNWEPAMTDIVESVHNGTWESHPKQDWWYGFAEGGVELVPFSYLVPDDVKKLINEKQKAIAGRELEVFPGMSDEELQNIYYFEPNVVGDLPKRS